MRGQGRYDEQLKARRDRFRVNDLFVDVALSEEDFFELPSKIREAHVLLAYHAENLSEAEVKHLERSGGYFPDSWQASLLLAEGVQAILQNDDRDRALRDIRETERHILEKQPLEQKAEVRITSQPSTREEEVLQVEVGQKAAERYLEALKRGDEEEARAAFFERFNSLPFRTYSVQTTVYVPDVGSVLFRAVGGSPERSLAKIQKLFPQATWS